MWYVCVLKEKGYRRKNPRLEFFVVESETWYLSLSLWRDGLHLMWTRWRVMIERTKGLCVCVYLERGIEFVKKCVIESQSIRIGIDSRPTRTIINYYYYYVVVLSAWFFFHFEMSFFLLSCYLNVYDRWATVTYLGALTSPFSLR